MLIFMAVCPDGMPSPWGCNAQYRQNVLDFLTALQGLGATPLLSIANPPYTSGDARLWWQQISQGEGDHDAHPHS
jgi:hypothetical protein